MADRLARFCGPAPPAALCVYYVFQKGSGHGRLYYFHLLTHLRSYWGYNVWTLSRISGVLFLLAIALLMAAVFVQFRRGRALWQPALLAGLLIVIGSALPYQIDDWFLVGSRTLPFALIAAVASLNLRPKGWHIATAVSLALLLVSSLVNTRASLAVQPKYDEFLSGLRVIPYGSKVLPIVQDLALGGNQYIQPFSGIEDMYNISRGGSNPYVFAAPWRAKPSDPPLDPSLDLNSLQGVRTGAPLLQFKYPPLCAYKFSPGGYRRADLRGAGRIYDYFIVYGRIPSITPAIEAQAKLVFSNGDLRIYQSLNQALAR